MAKPALNRIAGTIAVTALCAALAAKTNAQDGSLVLNEQLQLGDVFSQQQLNVVNARQQVTSSNTALGNQIVGGNDGQRLHFQNRQTGFAAAVARTRINLQGQDNGRVTAVAQARVNEASITTNHAPLSLDSQQYAYGSAQASVSLDNAEAHLVNGAQITAAAYSNALHGGGQSATITGQIDQTATGNTVAQVNSAARYVPGPSHYAAEAVANSTQLVGTGASNQRVRVNQDSEGWVAAYSNSSAANAWNSVTTASAAANRALLYNAGGSQVIATQQSSSSDVSSRSNTFAYDYGEVRSLADGVGNQAIVGNADIWVEVNNNQLNTGGVDVSATASGHNGYDAYVGANATGNSVTGYSCSDCGGVVRANNTQINTGAVNASATTNLTGSSRAVITGTTATGNSASFYVTRPGS